MPVQENRSELRDFPLFEGGPHYRALNTAGLRAPDRQNTLPLALLSMLVTWVPLAALSAAQGLFARGDTGHPFGGDVAVHLKLLLALPAFVLADRVVRAPLLAVLRRFLDDGLVTGAARTDFAGLVASALRLRDARCASLLMFALALLCSFLLARGFLSGAASNWHFIGSGGARRLSWAGWWHAAVSYPAYLFIILRFLYRLVLWWRLLGQISRMPLQIQPAHPDRSGGLVFLGSVLSAFLLPAFALSTALSSSTAALMLVSGASLVAHKNAIIAIAATVVVLFVVPLLFFMAPLARARKAALLRYDAFAAAQLRAFEGSWPVDPPAALDGHGHGHGHGDTRPGPSEVADLHAVVAAIRSMRLIPVERATFISLVVAVMLPFLVVLSTEIPVGDMLKKLLGLFA